MISSVPIGKINRNVTDWEMFANLQLTRDLKTKQTKKDFKELQGLGQAEALKPGCALEAAQKDFDNIAAWAFPRRHQSEPLGMRSQHQYVLKALHTILL